MTEIAFPKYARDASDASMSVLLRLAAELGSPAGGYRVIGGMAVHLLCREHAQLGPHVGTFDVDLALASAVLPREPEMGERLERIGLRPDDHNRHSMYWFADLGPGRSVPVDLLAPKLTDQSPEQMEVAGIRAWCPPGTGAVLDAPAQVTRNGTAWGIGDVRGVKIAVTSAPGLVMAKARSFKDRAYGEGRPRDLPKAGKHAYDLFFLLTSTASGPSALAKEWGALAHHLLKGKTLDILTDDFASESALGSRLAAGFIRANLGDAAGLEQMVSQQVKLFVDSVR
jgi:hypothetical protein